MIFITLSKFRKKPTKEMTTEVLKILAELEKKGVVTSFLDSEAKK
jgi:hypothetical protein